MLREALKRASRVLVGRVGTGAKATATVGTITATALYGGARGNDIKVVAKALVDDPTTFSVETYLGARLGTGNARLHGLFRGGTSLHV